MWILAKSITGYIRFMISGDPVSWQSRIQASVALSTIESESMAVSAERHKKPCDKLDYLSKWVGVSTFHTYDYGSSRRS